MLYGWKLGSNPPSIYIYIQDLIMNDIAFGKYNMLSQYRVSKWVQEHDKNEKCSAMYTEQQYYQYYHVLTL